MRNIKAYIESGVLELYVLGDLSPQEVVQVEEIASQNAEVRTEIEAIEYSLEQYAIKNSVEPSSAAENKLYEKLGLDLTDISIPAIPSSELHTEDPRILKLEVTHAKVRTLKFALVACVALLVTCTVALFIAYNRLNDAQDRIASLNLDKEKFVGVVSKLEFENKGYEKITQMVDSKDWATIKLEGQAFSPASKMKVFWNKATKSVLINHIEMNLPKTDADHEYQLWAMVNGKPVSLGVFASVDNTSGQALQEMQTIDQAQAFAVTIEPKGGSTNPTMEKLTVMGGV